MHRHDHHWIEHVGDGEVGAENVRDFGHVNVKMNGYGTCAYCYANATVRVLLVL